MADRKPISKRMRFEVFKRDRFTCQYCGRKSPDVILEVDHIVPVAEGGKNTLMNLVTSCRDCNRGKGKHLLDDNSAVMMQRKELEDLEELREQRKMLLKWRQELMKAEDESVDAVNDYLETASGYRANEHGQMNLRKWIRRFGTEEVMVAIDIAFDYYFDGDDDTWERAFNKIGGICYNRKVGRTADYYA
jgi:hypothetical protein